MAVKEIAVAAMLATPFAAGPVYAVDLAMATKMADGCEAKATQEDWKMNIAVVDDGADLVLFRRMDGAFLGSVDIAQMKARSSACSRSPPVGSVKSLSARTANPGRLPAWRSFRGRRRSRAACRSRPQPARTSARSE